MRRLDRLDVLSRRVFAGKLQGERRSKRRGQSVEFDDYRPYVPGDDLRHIDWNVLARLDRFFLKLFREEQDLSLHLILDCSPSMDAGNPSKLRVAHQLAMALGYIGLVNHNRVMVTRFGLAGPASADSLAPLRGRRSLRRLSEFLLATWDRLEDPERPRDAEDFHAAMRRLAITRSGAGVLVLLSDMLLPEGSLPGLNFLSGFAAGGFDAHLLHILSPDELDPARDQDTLVGDLRLTDAETGRAAEVTISAALLKRYRQRLDAFTADLDRLCKARGISRLLVPSDTPLDDLLLKQLRKRRLLG